MLAHLLRSGVAFSDMKGTPGAVNIRPDGMRAVFLQDPNGYWIEINDFRQPQTEKGPRQVPRPSLSPHGGFVAQAACGPAASSVRP